jgi:Domain of unknown function (DUF4062)
MEIFISSTFYDLKDIRDILVQVLRADGHEVIAYEKGTVPVNPGKHNYEQCFSKIKDCDCLIAILDRRFGGEYPIGTNKSITEAEIEQAWLHGKKTLVFVRQSVWDCKATQNHFGKGKKGIPYEAVKNIVDDPMVLEIIDRIRKKSQDNWIFQFNLPTDLLEQIRTQIRYESSSAVRLSDRGLRRSTKRHLKRAVQKKSNSFKKKLPRLIMEHLETNMSNFAVVTDEILQKLDQSCFWDWADIGVDLIEMM